MVNNKVCVVVGGTDVMCASVAKEMAKNGYVTAIVDGDKDAAKRIADEICTFGGLAKAFCGCASDIDSMRNIRDRISAEFGKCNVIVNMIGSSQKKPKNMNEILTIVQAFLKDMSDGQGCSIINMCPADMCEEDDLEEKITECTKKMAIGLAEAGIRANAVIYGSVISRSNKSDYLDEENNPTTEAEQMLSKIPMRRFGKPEEIVGALKYLTDPVAASYTTGTIIRVDGGYSLNK